jgi:hypothetical protein
MAGRIPRQSMTHTALSDEDSCWGWLLLVSAPPATRPTSPAVLSRQQQQQWHVVSLIDITQPTSHDCAVYPLLPLSDTILLTSMLTIAEELNASYTAVTATMSLYLLAAGVGFALWGPVSGTHGPYHPVTSAAE